MYITADFLANLNSAVLYIILYYIMRGQFFTNQKCRFMESKNEINNN